ncbi:MAG: ethanolamine ammonia-lyase subunit EutB [Flavobacteriaceae bacterium]
MNPISRKEFLAQAGLLGTSVLLFKGCNFGPTAEKVAAFKGVTVALPGLGEDLFTYIKIVSGKMDLNLYRQIIGAANEFKEGDQTLGLTADSEASRANARTLLSNTRIQDLEAYSLFEDELQQLIQKTTFKDPKVRAWTMGELKAFVLTKSEEDIKAIMPGLSSDIIGCLVKLMTNEELIAVGQKVFNPLPNSKIGAKGYLSARVQPNSPTDNVEDICWQVFDAWSYGVGDLVLGTNPVSSEPSSVAKIEAALYDIIQTFELEETLPNCVLSHIDVQAQVEELQPGTTGIWFQSLAGTAKANQTFDVTIEKMFAHIANRTGQYGLYAETGQGADFTNGHGEGFDMVVHESRKYGFLRALKQKMAEGKAPEEVPWVHVNDVAGFIGPEVFKTKEQLVRCCLEDTVMGKLHGLPIGLDICSTLHMEIDLEDLDWCIEQILPANPAYLMALPTKNDPMLSYLTTAFNNHVKIREKFGYKINDAMWDFFKRLQVVDEKGKATEHFGDPVWVYYQYRLAKQDNRSKEEIYKEGKECLARIRGRGVPIAEGYGEELWDLDLELDLEVHRLYEDAKVSLWTPMEADFIAAIPAATRIYTQSEDRQDYVYHPESGEQLSGEAIRKLKTIRSGWGSEVPDIQILISDGLNARALMDEGHLMPYLEGLRQALEKKNFSLGAENIVITHGRVRAGYACGEQLFGQEVNTGSKGIIHIIGERPGSGHHNFSAYLTAASPTTWKQKGKVDHDISRVVSGISDTALKPEKAVQDTLHIFDQLFMSV